MDRLTDAVEQFLLALLIGAEGDNAGLILGRNVILRAFNGEAVGRERIYDPPRGPESIGISAASETLALSCSNSVLAEVISSFPVVLGPDWQ